MATCCAAACVSSSVSDQPNPDGTTPLPNALFTDVRPHLTIAQWAVLSAIAFRVCWARQPAALSFNELAVEANVDRRTVITAIRALVDLGVLTVTRGGPEAGYRHVYRLA